MKTLYFDCFAGASGNMILGALLGLGIDLNDLTNELRRLKTPDFEIRHTKVDRSGISSSYAEVIVPVEKQHRHLKDILAILRHSEISQIVKDRSSLIFNRLAEAEAKVHGIPLDQVHFHEVGALDSIIDVVGSCIGLELLGIERFICSKIHVGSGFVEMEHGRFPVPPPAVAELLKAIPIYSTDIVGELITPTGAAIISTLSTSYGSIPELEVEKIGYGAGRRTYDGFPNVLRLLIGNSEEASFGDHPHSLVLLETNLDDVSPQVLGYAMERAFELKALDCWFTPIHMKKNRPATMISILCEPEDREALSALLYSETTTLGIRIRSIERTCLSREIVSVNTKFGAIDIKIAKLEGKVMNAMPEYEQVKNAALKFQVPFRVVSEASLESLRNINNMYTTAAQIQ